MVLFCDAARKLPELWEARDDLSSILTNVCLTVSFQKNVCFMFSPVKSWKQWCFPLKESVLWSRWSGDGGATWLKVWGGVWRRAGAGWVIVGGRAVLSVWSGGVLIDSRLGIFQTAEWLRSKVAYSCFLWKRGCVCECVSLWAHVEQ